MLRKSTKPATEGKTQVAPRSDRGSKRAAAWPSNFRAPVASEPSKLAGNKREVIPLLWTINQTAMALGASRGSVYKILPELHAVRVCGRWKISPERAREYASHGDCTA
jgi:hypothetical protein